MSRDRNNLQRHIEECLVDRDEMAAWIARAQAIASFNLVTKQDWLFHGHLSPGEWLFDCGLEDDEIWDDWGDELLDAPELNEWDDWPRHEIRANDEAAYDEYWEPMDLEFGGRYYPTEHVQDARALCGVA